MRLYSRNPVPKPLPECAVATESCLALTERTKNYPSPPKGKAPCLQGKHLAFPYGSMSPWGEPPPPRLPRGAEWKGSRKKSGGGRAGAPAEQLRVARFPCPQRRGRDGEQPLPSFLTSADSSIAPLRPPAFNRRASPPPARLEAPAEHLGKCSPPASALGPPAGAAREARRDRSPPRGAPAGAQRTTVPMRPRASRPTSPPAPGPRAGMVAWVAWGA